LVKKILWTSARYSVLCEDSWVLSSVPGGDGGGVPTAQSIIRYSSLLYGVIFHTSSMIA